MLKEESRQTELEAEAGGDRTKQDEWHKLAHSAEVVGPLDSAGLSDAFGMSQNEATGCSAQPAAHLLGAQVATVSRRDRQ